MTISVLTPTLNSARTLEACLAAVRAQDVPAEDIEIIVADAGSTDGTVDIANRFGARVVPNPLRTGEAGKSAALAVATGELIALVDSDNILPSPDWLRRMVAPFDDPAVFASEPIRYDCRPGDPALTRYFALLGMNDPLCLFAGNYDRECAITGRWTGLGIPAEKRDGWFALDLGAAPGGALPTLGANGTILRRSVLADATTAPYYFDIDVVQQLVVAGHTRFAKVDIGIVHLYAGRLRDFSRKQDRRVRDFLHFRRGGSAESKVQSPMSHVPRPTSDGTQPQDGPRPGTWDSARQTGRSYSWKKSGMLRGVILFSLATATVIPLLVQMLLGAMRKPDSAWWYHIPVCWITFFRYASAVLLAPFRRSAPASREHWQRT